MPIRFRCTYCNRLLGIATRKAGTETTCPHCGYAITVPVPTEDEAKTERVNTDDVDQLLGNHAATERMSEPATQVLPPPRPEPPKAAPAAPAKPKPKAAAAPAPKAEPKPKPPADPNNPPLFEGDFDDLFGDTPSALEQERPKAAPTTGTDALSLDDPPGSIVISSQKATLLLCGVVLLLALAFAAGYFVAK